MTKRHSPVRHTVNRHKRRGKWIEEFERGSGARSQRKSRVVGKKHLVYDLVGTERDERFNPDVHQDYKNDIKDVTNYLEGKAHVIAEAKNDTYTVKMIESVDHSKDRKAKCLFILNSRPNEPVPTGFWMDSPEEHWGLTDKKYFKLPRRARATLEAKEQLNKWIHRQYYTEWLDFYKPKLYDKLFWGSGLDLTESYKDRNKKHKKMVMEIW